MCCVHAIAHSDVCFSFGQCSNWNDTCLKDESQTSSNGHYLGRKQSRINLKNGTSNQNIAPRDELLCGCLTTALSYIFRIFYFFSI
ncbi:hypothetical protein ANCCAN_29709 [Ancylostoma caninum]|uniref:Uncharacterized protein n=1 Tax=Ancylostoma caninum TaxID=29170 RepID=A0A368EXV1_ANCCA|nr:hypothetical protein ANCCAN_29709 [Ancylostoma caninum]